MRASSRVLVPLRAGGGLGVVQRRGLLDALLTWARERGFRDYSVRVGAHHHHVVLEPDSVRRVLTDPDAFPRDVRPTKHLFGGGLLRLTGAPWAARRRRFTPPFKRGALGDAAPIVVDEVHRLADAWAAERSEPFRPARGLSDCMARILGRYLFGYDFTGRSLHRSLVVLSMDSVLRHLLGRPPAVLLNGRAVRRARRVLDEVCGEILESGGDTAFLAALRSGIGRDYDRRVALDELRTFLIAGHETSATALSWIVALLAERPGLQEALRAEARRVGVGSDRHTEALTLTTAVVRESMRLYPPVPLSISRATRAVRLGELEVPAGARVNLCSYVVHRCPERWPDPERFDPSRFDGELPPQEAYLPFLGGPHLCLGRGLAMLEMRTATAILMDRFTLSAPQGPPEVNLRLSLHPRGLVVRARPT